MNRESTVSVTRVVEADAAALWSRLRSGDGVDRYIAMITSCRLEGEGEGARRFCGTETGEIEETLLTIDDDARVFRYCIDKQTLLPVENYIGMLHVVPLDGRRSHVLWSATFGLTDSTADEAVSNGLREAFVQGIDDLAAEVLS